MNWLLKIVEGPVKGAEIALVEGIRLKVGSADTCDIVLADNTIPGEAFELDVAPEAVTLIDLTGAVSELVPFEVKSIGTTSFAVGPAEGNWKALDKKPVETPKGDGVGEGVGQGEDQGQGEGEGQGESSKKKHHGIGCLATIIGLILFGTAIWALFHYRPACCEEYLETIEGCCAEYASPYIEAGKENVKTCWDALIQKVEGWSNEDEPIPEPKVDPVEALNTLAFEHDLKLTESEGTYTLSGNLARRTERRAIRELALAIDQTVKFDLTDDESLKDAANELLFAITGGTLKAVKAENRVVTIVGYAETSEELAKNLVALNADVKGIDNVDTTEVKLGHKAPEPIIVPSPAESIVDKAVPEVPSEMPERNAKIKKVYPVAGILMKPYPCVVMKNGLRLVEGSELGAAHIERIEAGKIVLKEGNVTFEWKP